MSEISESRGDAGLGITEDRVDLDRRVAQEVVAGGEGPIDGDQTVRADELVDLAGDVGGTLDEASNERSGVK